MAIKEILKRSKVIKNMYHNIDILFNSFITLFSPMLYDVFEFHKENNPA